MKKERIMATRDGLFHLHTVAWTPDQQPVRAVMQLVHGISEYVNRYEDFAVHLAEHGIAVVGCDLPGHGDSAGSPDDYGYFAAENGWVLVCQALLDLSAEIKEEYGALPYFLFGHSMGSFLVRTLMIDYPALADGFILSGTGQPDARLLSGGVRITELAVRLLGARRRSPRIERLAMGAYNQKFSPARTEVDWISRDEAVVDSYAADPMCNFVPTVSLFRDMIGGLNYIGKAENLRKMDPSVPIYLFSGDHDPVGEHGTKVKALYNAMRDSGCRNVCLKLYPEGRHEMLNELNRDEVYADVLSWINKQLEARDDLS